MNKEIEEMARVACEHFDYDMVGQPCTKCRTYNKHCYTIHKAEILYNAGYRKLPEDSVVLTREECERLKLELAIEKKRADESYTQKEVEEIIASKERIKSKETVKKILTELLDFVNDWFECVENNDFGIEFNKISKGIAEKYGVKIKE